MIKENNQVKIKSFIYQKATMEAWISEGLLAGLNP